ncbi:MAG: matrixin family metalloprotease [Bryobacteraceae bacterium]|nr:matrixin family metalloprotease [Bryobacteraceae bacterium]
MRRLAALLLVLAWPACAYYHFVRYNTSAPPFQPIYDRFDLKALPGRAVPYFITLNGSLTLAPGDSETAVLSQIRAAAAVWNGVPTSELRLVFGGFREDGSALSTPHIQVEFTDELPPGVIAQGGPVARLDPAEGPDGLFTPIARSLLRLPRDLSSRPSWSERFFLTVVHEFGHTIGLQHTWTSGVMSTEITRATTKAQPLGQDDVAAVSVLYPTADFRKTTGVITGRVTMNGQGVALASVVAVISGRSAISTLTAPDGTYRMEGVPPGSYFLYAHTLPPSIAGEPQPVNLELPVTPAGRVLPGPAFQTTFYPGSAVPSSTVAVEAGKTLESIDFRVTPMSRVNLHSIQTYSFYNRNAIKPATFTMPSSWRALVFTGFGASALSPGLSVSFLSAPETVLPGSLRDYSPGYLQAEIRLSPFSGDGPRHLLFQLNGETYVLPSGAVIRKSDPPSITSVTPQPDGWLWLEGANLSGDTAVWVDGVPARTRYESGQLRILPPPAPSGHTGVIVALNPDGQSSLHVHGNASPVLSYADAPQPQVALNPVEIPAGAEMAVELTGRGADFRLWTPWLGTGTSDVAVRRVWGVGESRAIAWLAASPSAMPGLASMSAGVGLAGTRLTQTLTITAAGRVPYVRMSAISGQYVYPGARLTVPVAEAPPGLNVTNVQARLGGLPAVVLDVATDSVTLQIPRQLQPGAHLLNLVLGGVQALPAAVEVGPLPPVILRAVRPDGNAVTAAAPARPGDVIQLVIAGLAEEPDPGLDGLRVFSGEVRHEVRSVRSNSSEPGTHVVEVRLAEAEAVNGTIAVTVWRNGAYNIEPFLLPFAR